MPEPRTPQAASGQSRPLPAVWAVILNWNGLDDTTRCIQSLQLAGYPSLSIVVVDNASTDGSGGALAGRFPDIPVLIHTSNDGYSAGNNIGIRYAMDHGAACVLVLNNDVVVERGFLEPMVETLLGDPAIGMVTCKAYFRPGSDRIYVTAGSIRYLLCTGVGLPPELSETECTVEFISGCIFLCRREVFEDVGLLDERFFMYFEDVEFSRRAGKRWRLAYTPRGVVYHKSGGGEGFQNFSPLYLYHMTRNRFWVFRDEALPYRIYVALYCMLLTVVKMAAVCRQVFKGRPASFVVPRLRALWNGLVDGFRGENVLPEGRRY